MSYLTGKRFEYLGEGNAAGTKTGVIASEPFPNNQEGSFYNTCVAVLWEDGSMEGATDVELLKITGDANNEVILNHMDGSRKIISNHKI